MKSTLYFISLVTEIDLNGLCDIQGFKNKLKIISYYLLDLLSQELMVLLATLSSVCRAHCLFHPKDQTTKSKKVIFDKENAQKILILVKKKNKEGNNY